MTSKITATYELNGQQLTSIPVVNPGDCLGKTWLLEIGGSVSPLFLIVEADGPSDAIDELADSDEYGHHIVVADEDLGDYDPETCHYGPSGQVIDLDWLEIHDDEGQNVPFPCRYHVGDLPSEGVLPTEFCWDDCDDEEA